MQGNLNPEIVKDALIIDEFSLNGIIRHARGVLPMAATARQHGFRRNFVSEQDAPEAALIPDLEVYPVNTLSALWTSGRVPPHRAYQPSDKDPEPLHTPTDFAEVKGQAHVKRTLEVAAAGGHNFAFSLVRWATRP